MLLFTSDSVIVTHETRMKVLMEVYKEGASELAVFFVEGTQVIVKFLLVNGVNLKVTDA